MARLNGSDVVTRNGSLLTVDVDNELMAMSVDRGICYGLNAVATRIWTLIERPMTIDALCARLLEEFDVDEQTCRNQTVDLLVTLRDEHMISVQAG